jgi:DNA polymerase-1
VVLVSKNERLNDQATLFQLDGLDQETAWVPPSTLPELARYDELWVDTETTGKNTVSDSPVGLAVATPDDKAFYLPFGHRSGNLDPEQVKRWARRELRNKTLVFSWAKFDAHMFRNWGLPLDEMNVKLRDVQHQACLLNEHRRKSGLDLLAKEILGLQKVELSTAIKSQMAKVHSSLVGAYAERDVRLTRALDLAMRPQIKKEDLQRVLDLEDSLIFPVVEMEGNGCPVDVEKLLRWRKEVRRQWEIGLRDLRELAGFPVNPESHPDMCRLFNKWNLNVPLDEVDGQPTFAALYLKPMAATAGPGGGEHAGIKLVLRVKALGSLLSKFLDKYAESVGPDGKLRYNLHQLRADDYGTITGRFSAAGDETGGINPQQVFHPENQAKKLGTRDFAIRELYIPGSGLWVSADAEQIEYRLFAGLASNADVLAAYAKDPDTDFHDLVTEIVRATADPSATRKDTKNTNFAKVYGAGLKKIRRMLGTTEEKAKAFVDAYDRAFPEVAKLISSVEYEIRRRHRETGMGFVRTLMGRRRRWPLLEKLHAGLNAHIQGTAADINKIKLRQVYDERKHLEITMRLTVHDELDGDIQSEQKAVQLRELLNEPALPGLKVPIRWACGVGPNWGQVKDFCRQCGTLAIETKKSKKYCAVHQPAELKEAA